MLAADALSCLIGDEDMIRKILKHMVLWAVKRKLHLMAHGPLVDLWVSYDDHATPNMDEYLNGPICPKEFYF